MNERKPTDGKPYYCALCGCGFAEYLACEMPDCKLESEATAKQRQKPKRKEAKMSDSPGGAAEKDTL